MIPCYWFFHFSHRRSRSLFGPKFWLSKSYTCTSQAIINLVMILAAFAPIIVFIWNDPYLCFFVSFSVSHTNGPEACQCFNSGYDGFLLWEETLMMEIQHNTNVCIMRRVHLKRNLSCMCPVFVMPCDRLCNWKQCFWIWIWICRFNNRITSHWISIENVCVNCRKCMLHTITSIHVTLHSCAYHLNTNQ